MQRAGQECAYGCVCVCIHVWWDLLVDSLMLRLLLTSASYTSHFSLIYRFSIFQPHTLHHSILPILCFSVMFAPLHWSHEAICLPLFGSFLCRLYFYAIPFTFLRQYDIFYFSSQRYGKTLKTTLQIKPLWRCEFKTYIWSSYSMNASIKPSFVNVYYLTIEKQSHIPWDLITEKEIHGSEWWETNIFFNSVCIVLGITHMRFAKLEDYFSTQDPKQMLFSQDNF